MPKFHLILRGNSDQFAKTIPNIQNTIITPYDIERIYVSSYHHQSYPELLSMLNPIFHVEQTDRNGQYLARHVIACAKQVITDLESDLIKLDDWVIVMRIDAILKDNLKDVVDGKGGLDLTKMYCLCLTETHNRAIDDNLYIMPVSMIKTLIQTMESVQNGRYNTHQITDDFNSAHGKGTVTCLFEGHFEIRISRPLMTFAREI